MQITVCKVFKGKKQTENREKKKNEKAEFYTYRTLGKRNLF